jgi:cytochrome bd ubiquinol oxidase subunit II
MTTEQALAAVIVLGLTAYALLAGADFGGGVWDLLARGRDAPALRRLVADSLGPVWEANHVWLIFVIVAMFSGFPVAFGVIGSTLELPLAIALVGIVLRGAGYVYRAYGDGAAGGEALWGRVFAVCSLVTPFALGVTGAALATGVARPDDPTGPLTSPFGLVAGALAVAVTAFLAAVYLCRDAARAPGGAQLVPALRRRAIGAGVVAGALAAALLPLLWRDAPAVAGRFPARGAPFAAASALGGLAAVVLLWRRHFVWARLAAGLAAGGVLWGWAASQYPDLVVGRVTIDAAAAPAANQRALLIAIAAGMVFLVPAVVVLFRVAARPVVTVPPTGPPTPPAPPAPAAPASAPVVSPASGDAASPTPPASTRRSPGSRSGPGSPPGRAAPPG